jgi:hypothetical protein
VTADHQDRLDRYLDGGLGGAEREAFERDLARSPELRAQADLQGRIDAGLRRLFTPPGVAAPAGAAPRARRPWVWGLGLAAAAALAAAGVWYAVGRRAEPTVLEGVYRSIVSAGFTPKEVCTTDEAFEKWVADKYGEPLAPEPDHAGVEFVGWSYARAMTTYSGVLLARVDGREVVVVLDHARNDIGIEPRANNPDLRVFRERFGNLVAYEVTPLEGPRVLESLRVPG